MKRAAAVGLTAFAALAVAAAPASATLRINNNTAATNAYRDLSATDSQMAKSLEKLSSGFRINRAGDDAAGLVISEALRSQVGGVAAHGPCTGQEAAEAHAAVTPPVPCVVGGPVEPDPARPIIIL